MGHVMDRGSMSKRLPVCRRRSLYLKGRAKDFALIFYPCFSCLTLIDTTTLPGRIKTICGSPITWQGQLLLFGHVEPLQPLDLARD